MLLPVTKDRTNKAFEARLLGCSRNLRCSSIQAVQTEGIAFVILHGAQVQFLKARGQGIFPKSRWVLLCSQHGTQPEFG